jgi:hypothetical protein
MACAVSIHELPRGSLLGNCAQYSWSIPLSHSPKGHPEAVVSGGVGSLRRVSGAKSLRESEEKTGPKAREARN